MRHAKYPTNGEITGSERAATELVELANQVITARGIAGASGELLSEVLRRAGIVERDMPPHSSHNPSAAEIFDAFAYSGREALRSELEQYFELVAGPCSPLHSLHEGDVIIRRAEAGQGHVAFVADPERWHYDQLSKVGLTPETHRTGEYVQVVEGGMRPHALADKFARQVADTEGRLPYDQLVLCPHEKMNQHSAESYFEQDQSPQANISQPIVDTDLAIAPFTSAIRNKLASLLSQAESRTSLAWNAAQHPARSGVDPQLIVDRLKDYVDLPAIDNAIRQFHAANPSRPIDLTTSVVNSVFVEAVHQFQKKCFTDMGRHGENWDGKAGSKVLHSLGIIEPKGKNPLADVNPHSKVKIKDKGITGQIGGTIIDHRNWFDFIVNPSIFGWTIDKDPGIHYELAKRLRIAENVLLTSPAYKNLTPAELGKALGITEVHKGYRRTKESNSYHNFGLGIDISYDPNPFVRGAKILEVIKDAALLLSGIPASFFAGAGYAQKYLFSLSKRFSTDQIHDILRQNHEDFTNYLHLVGNQAEIKRLLGRSGAPTGLLETGESLEVAVARWQKKIEAHLEEMKKDGTFLRNDLTYRDPLNGFLSHKKELVLALRDKACLAWGAVDFGDGRGDSSGDIMHFDLRAIDPFSKINDSAAFHPCRTGNMSRAAAHSQNREMEILHYGLLESSTISQTMPHVGWQNASPSGQSKIAIPPDPAGWNEAKWKVGQILRIPLEGLQAGNHDPNNLPALTGEAADGKAVILIPKALTRDKIDPTKPLEVLLHFHGHSIGYRQANSTIDDRTGHWERGWVEDVDIDQIAQQIEASGRSLVAVLPQGTNHSGFGKAPSPPKNYFKNYLDEVFKALVSRQIWTQIPTVKRVILSAHSGGGDFLVNSVGDLPTFDLPPAVFLFDAINNDTGRSAYWIWLKRYLDAELNLITSRKLSDPLQYVKDSLQWLAFHSNRSYQRAHDQFAKDLNAWFASHEKDLGGKSTPVYEQMKANYQVIPVGHGTHYMMGVLMANQLFPIMQPLAYALSGLPFHTAGTDSLSTSPTGQSSKHRPWVEQTDLDSEREVWRQKMLDVQASFEADDSVSATSYQNKIFAIESADARLRNNDLSPKKFKAGDTLPSGKKIGDYVTLPRGAQVKISDMKTDGNKKVFALVYEATAGSAASPLGWTSTENFKGKLHNETFGAEPANYIVEPAARADFFTVGNHEALVRKGSPSYALDKTKAKLSQGSFVAVVEESKDTTPAGKYVKVVSLKKSGGSFITDKDLGWTAKNNLVPGLADYKGPNAAWESFDYVKQIDLLAIVAIESKEEKIARDVDPAYIQMIQAAAAEGIEIVLNDGFRRYSDQEKLYNLYQQGKGNPAYPPGSSNHQNGIAFDLIVQHGSADKGVGTGTVYDWLKKNATSHGFVRTVPGEAWHWEYRPVLADQLQKQGKYKSWQLSERENEDFLDEEEDNAAEQVAGIDWCNIRRRISCVALVQEARWTRPDGTKRLENEPDMLPVLEEYWRTVPSINPTVKAQQSANDATAWSAAFICFIIYTAGVRAAHGFEFGERHMAYIVGALRNRERSDRNRPFWLYDQVELAKEATPEIGDLLCFNRVDNGTMTNHSYANLRRQFWEPNQNAAPTGSSHCSVVVDIISRGGRRFIQTVGGNESVPGLGDRGWTVRLKEIEIDQHGAILNPNAIHVFGVIKLLECRNLT